jgi:hypothetical protein
MTRTHGLGNLVSREKPGGRVERTEPGGLGTLGRVLPGDRRQVTRGGLRRRGLPRAGSVFGTCGAASPTAYRRLRRIEAM